MRTKRPSCKGELLRPLPCKCLQCDPLVSPLQVYIIEANPRASRTVPFVAKAIGHPLAKYASLLMSGQTLPELGFTEEPRLEHVAVKEAVLPFEKFPGLTLGHISGMFRLPAACSWSCGCFVMLGECTMLGVWVLCPLSVLCATPAAARTRAVGRQLDEL